MLYFVLLLEFAFQTIWQTFLRNSLLQRRFSKSLTYLLNFLLGMLQAQLGFWCGEQMLLKALVVLSTRLLYILCMYKGTVREVFKVLGIEFLLEIITEVLNVFLWVVVLKVGVIDITMQISWNRIILVALYLPIQIFVMGGAGLYFSKRTLKLEQQEKLSFFLPFSQGLLLWAWGVTAYFKSFTVAAIVGGVGVLFTILADVYVLKTVKKARQKYEMEERNKRLQEIYAIKLKSYSDIQKQNESMAKISHDINNQLTAILVLLQQGNTEKAISALKGLENIYHVIQIYEYTPNMVANAVLSIQAQQCKNQQILFEVTVRLPANVPISDVYLCSLLANLLDNARAATVLLPPEQRKISIKILHLQGCIAINCRNTYCKNHLPTGGTGYGTQILKDIAAIYSGEYKVEKSEDLYAASLILNFSSKTE